MYLNADPMFMSAEAKFLRFNFHPESEVALLEEALTSRLQDRPRVVVLAGEEHSGRRYLAESAISGSLLWRAHSLQSD